MPAWITITLADLQDARVAELVTAFREEALGDDQADPMPRQIQTVTDEIRRCIAFCPSTPLDADPATVPAGLRALAVEKIIRTMKGRLLQAFTDDEKDAERLYQKRLEQLTRCEWPVDKPDNPLGTPITSAGGNIQVVSSRSRPATGDSLRGL